MSACCTTSTQEAKCDKANASSTLIRRSLCGHSVHCTCPAEAWALLQAKVSPVAKDLISRLLCDAEHRIGSHGGAAEIKVPICHGNTGLKPVATLPSVHARPRPCPVAVLHEQQ